MGRRSNSTKKRRSAIAVLEATMNFNIDFCANSEKQVSSTSDNSGNKIPKSKSCTRISISEELNEPDPLEEDDLPQIKNDVNKVEDITAQLEENISKKEIDNQISLPYDVWELISNYILPECIGTFSRICKDSYAVISQPPFWAKLHRDFILEEQLTPRNSTGLKAKVIRHLFQTYSPFQLRLNSTKAKIYDPHTLVGLICLKHEWSVISCLEETANRRVHFDITFGKLNPPESLWQKEMAKYYGKKPSNFDAEEPVENFEELLDNDTFDKFTCFDQKFVGDINHNSEECNKVLRLELSSFRPGLPDSILGLKLQNICVTATGPGFRFQKLVFKFVPKHIGLKQCSSDSIILDIGDIINLKILNWYHPCYPGNKFL